MKRIYQKIGVLAYWISWPALYIYLRHTKRTRALIICDDQFLALRSWYGSGDWSLPGGGLHKGENSLQGLIREVQEETGIALYEKDVKYLFTNKISKRGVSYEYDCFVVHLEQKPVINIQKYEISEYCWLLINNPTTRISPDAAHALTQWQNS